MSYCVSDSRSNADRAYSGHSGGQHGNSGDWQPSNAGAGPRDGKDNRSYTRGGSHAGSAPGNSGILGQYVPVIKASNNQGLFTVLIICVHLKTYLR